MILIEIRMRIIKLQKHDALLSWLYNVTVKPVKSIVGTNTAGAGAACRLILFLTGNGFLRIMVSH